MKKNLRIISAAAAALLAVSPVVASGVVNPGSAVVKADSNSFSMGTSVATSASSNTNNATKPANQPYFTTNNNVIGQEDANNPTANVVATQVTIAAGDTISQVANQITGLNLVFHTNNNDSEVYKVSHYDLRTQLANSGVVFKSDTEKIKDPKNSKKTITNSNYYTIKSVPSNSFNLKITGKSGNQSATIQIPIVPTGVTSTPTNTDSPIVGWSVNGKQQTNGKDVASVNGQVFQVAVGSQFNPTNFTNSNGEQITISAQQNATNTTFASLTATSNPVNTSEQGRFYNVTLTATGLTGKTTTVTYTVLITSSGKQSLYGNGTINTYSLYGNNVFNGPTTFKSGDQVYVADGTRTINKVSYSQVSTKSKSDAAHSNIWVKTSDLTKPAAPVEKSETHVVMVTSKAYDKNGNYLGHQYDNYTNINIVPTVVTIKGKTYYKVAGKDEYVRVTNITGTHRTLRHNAYIYWSSYRRTPGTGKVYRGQSVTTYGAAIRFKNGKRYYRIDGCRPTNKRYIKQANFF